MYQNCLPPPQTSTGARCSRDRRSPSHAREAPGPPGQVLSPGSFPATSHLKLHPTAKADPSLSLQRHQLFPAYPLSLCKCDPSAESPLEVSAESHLLWQIILGPIELDAPTLHGVLLCNRVLTDLIPAFPKPQTVCLTQKPHSACRGPGGGSGQSGKEHPKPTKGFLSVCEPRRGVSRGPALQQGDASHSLRQQEQSPPVREPKGRRQEQPETRRGGHGSCGVFYVATTALPSSSFTLCAKSSSPGFELQRNGIILHSGRGTTNIMFVRFSHVIVS